MEPSVIIRITPYFLQRSIEGYSQYYPDYSRGALTYFLIEHKQDGGQNKENNDSDNCRRPVVDRL